MVREGLTTARRPVFQSPGLGASPPHGTAARRGVSPRPSELGCGVTPAPGALVRAAWGSRGARPPPFNTPQHRDLVVHRTTTAALKSTNGPGAPSVAARKFCGSMASTQARD
jgi:hypothetical protein